MRKILIALALVFLLGKANSQGIFQPVTPTAYGSNNLRIKSSVALLFPTGSGRPTFMNTYSTDSLMFGIRGDSSTGRVYVYNPKTRVWAFLRDSANGAGTTIPWDSITGKPSNFSTTYALSNDIQDSIQNRVPYENATRNLIIGNYRVSARTLLMDSLMARSSSGINIYSNSGTHVALFGGGGGSGTTFYGGINGTTGTFSGDLLVNGLTVGKGGGSLSSNTAFGLSALRLDQTPNGVQNTAIGAETLYTNGITASSNTAVGFRGLYANTTGGSNTAVGVNSLLANTSGSENVAIGNGSLTANTSAVQNTAIGLNALGANTIGERNTAIGNRAGVGYTSSRMNRRGNENIYIGHASVGSDSANNNEIVIGTNIVGNGSNTVTIGGGSNSGNYFTGFLKQTSITNSILKANSTGQLVAAVAGDFPSLSGLYVDLTTTQFVGGSKSFSNDIEVNSFKVGRGSGNYQSNTGLGYLVFRDNTTGEDNTAIGNSVLYDNETGSSNTGVGYRPLFSNVSGNFNTAVGTRALYFNTASNNTALGNRALYNNTTGSNNIAIGSEALSLNTTGSNNVGIGYSALLSNTTASSNTAVGGQTLYANTTGSLNSAFGYLALRFNTTATVNTAIGAYSLYENTTGFSNTAVGASSLQANTTGEMNVSVGAYALAANTTGLNNTAVGTNALAANTLGSYNSAFGRASLVSLTNAVGNTALGDASLAQTTTGEGNVAVGWQSFQNNTVGTYNTAVGVGAGSSIIGGSSNTNSASSVFIGAFSKAKQLLGNNEIVIGFGAEGNGSNTVTIGNSSVTATYLKGTVNYSGAISGTSATFSGVLGLSNVAALQLRNGSSLRWELDRDGTESGSNSGSNFQLYRYDDAGGFLGTSLGINRSTGAVTLGGSLTATSGLFSGDVTLFKSGNANLYVQTSTDNTPYLQLSRNSGTYAAGIYVSNTGQTIIENLAGSMLTFSNTRTAEFISSVTANGDLILNNLTNSVFYKAAGSNYYLVGMDGSYNYRVYNANYGRTELSFAQATGAATFISTVTATQYIVGAAATASDVSVLFKTNTGDFSLVNQQASHSFGIYDNLNSRYNLNFSSTGVASIGSDLTGGANQNAQNAWHVLRGTGLTDGTSTYGSYGGFILNANGLYTSGARRFLITNGLNASKFAIIRSSDATTNPSLGTAGALTAGTADFVIDNNGSVGIGTSAPEGILNVYSVSGGGTSYNALTLTNGSAGGASVIFKNAYGTMGTVELLTEDVGSGTFDDGVLIFKTTQDASSFERARISSRGNLGVGTNSPGYKIEASTTSSGSYPISATNITDNLRILLGTAAGGLLNIQGKTISAGSSYHLSINGEGGQVTVGTTSVGYGLYTNQRLTVNPTNDGMVVAPLAENFSAYTVQSDNNTGTRYALHIANGSSTNVGSISYTSSATAFNTSSDYRLKQDLRDFNGLGIVSAIKVYDVQWKSDGSRSHAVIAHELQEILPYAVTGIKDGKTMQGVDYSKIVPALVKAIQELKAEVETLKQKQ